jgi:hypothetical protein
MSAPRAGQVQLSVGSTAGLLEIEVLRLPDTQRRQLLHLRLRLRPWLLALALACLRSEMYRSDPS